MAIYTLTITNDDTDTTLSRVYSYDDDAVADTVGLGENLQDMIETISNIEKIPTQEDYPDALETNEPI